MLMAFFLISSAILVNAQQINHMEKLKTAGYAPVNGLNMYYEIYGDGVIPLVLIHGGGSTIETSFGNILPLLANHNKIIAVELQAHGRTSDRNTPETFEHDADDVAALLDYLRVDKANFFGFSSGGTTTLQIAIRHPQLANKLIVVSGAYEREGFIDGFFEGFPHATLDHMPQALREAFLKVTPDQARLQMMFEKDVARMINFKDIPDDLIRSIKVPVLFMSSQEDAVKPEHTIKMSHAVSGAKLAVLPGYHGALMGTLESDAVKNGSNLYKFTASLINEFLRE